MVREEQLEIINREENKTMELEQFLSQVEDLADFGSRSEVEQAVKVSLGTLGERLYRTRREKLASQLPDPLKDYLESEVDGEAVRQDTPRYSLEEYYKRVAARADLSLEDAVARSRRVMVVLTQAVSPELLDEILDGLPDEYRELFGQNPQDPASPTALN